MALVINQEELTRAYEALTKVTSQQVQEGMDNLARLTKEAEGNDIMEKLVDNCRRMQTSYNDEFVPATETLLEQFKTLQEFKDVIARAAAGMGDAKVGSSSLVADEISMPEL